MKIKTKMLFRLYGRIHWLDKYDQRNYAYISEEKPLYKWATDQTDAERLFRRTIFLALKKRLPRQCRPPKLADIRLYDGWIEKIDKTGNKKIPVQRQLNLFKESQ